MICVENLTKEYGDVRAIDRLSFEVFEGEVLGFLGPNGAGKTTTMRILTCFFPPTSGRATVAGFDVVEEPDEVRRVIGYLPEGVPLYREMTVTSALDFIAHAKGFNPDARRRYVDAAIEETGLGAVRGRMIGHLSKGFRQRVGLAQAILGEPKVLILDEPTAGLDPRQITEVRALIRNMAGRRTVILSTHILPEVQVTCSRVAIINEGRIAASGTPEKLTTQIQTEQQSVACIAGPRALVVEALHTLPGVRSVDWRLIEESGAKPGRVPTPEMNEYAILSARDMDDVNPAVAELAAARGWKLLELRHEGMTLEQIFLKVVAGETSVATEATGVEADTGHAI
jgi:ABC-2 type transport system ATP-binding protein